jgi:lipoprotein NlpI
LKDYFEKNTSRASRDWPTRIIAFVLGEIKEGNFVPGSREQGQDLVGRSAAVDWFIVEPLDNTKAKPSEPKVNKGRVCEAWFYAGMKRLVSDDKAGARDCLQKCVETRQQTFVEYDLAISQLKKLENPDHS